MQEITRTDNLNLGITDKDLKRIWGESSLKIFISHIHFDKIFASKIKHKLSEIGISCFVAHEDIEPGTFWIEELDKALNTMDVCLCLLSEKYHSSKWTDQEIGFAYGRCKQIIPIIIDSDVTPYGFIQKIQAMTVSENKVLFEDEGKSYNFIAKLLRIILSNRENNEKLKESFIRSVENSNCYKSSNNLVNYFDLFDKFNDNHSCRLLKSFVYNNQVRDSNGFKEKLFEYLIKWNPTFFPDIDSVKQKQQKIYNEYKREMLI